MKTITNCITAALCCLLLISCGQMTGTTWQEQYDLGVRYLSESNYEEAIIAFTAAIEIDPKQPPAYVGRGDAYVGRAEDLDDESQDRIDLYKMALADYEQAISLGALDIQERYDAVQTALQNLKLHADAHLKLQALYECFAAGNLETAKSLMRQEDYQAISAAVKEGFLPYIGDTGNCLAVYPGNYYYFGGWENGQRNGHGLWVIAVFDADSDLESEVYDGTWQDDLPNGEGLITVIKNQEKPQLDERYTTSIHTEIAGSFKNGLYHGTIYETWHMNDGGTHIWTPITAVDGVYQPMPNIPDEIAYSDYYQEQLAAGRYIVALDQQNGITDLWNDGSPYAVFGFGDE